MTNAVFTGDMTVIFAEDNEIFLDAEEAALDYNELHFGADTLFAPGNAFVVANKTATHIEGYDPGSQDTMTLDGTNFTGASGTITHGEFVGDDTGGIIFDGTLNWDTTLGIKGGKLTDLDITAVDGSRIVAEGAFNMTAAGVITGTYTKQTVTAVSGTICELTGRFNVVTHAGQLTKIMVHDGAGNSLTLTGRFDAGAYFDTVGTSGTIGDIFEFGLSGRDNITGGKNDDLLQGFAEDDMLRGLDGNDTLDGGTGRDNMGGGLGDDLYIVDNIGDRVLELAGEGADTVNSTAANYTLTANVENLLLVTGAINGKGNDLANIITGTSSANTLDGAGGDDILIGGKGNDVYVFDALTDTATENPGEGTDTVILDFDNAGAALNIDVTSFPNVENLTVAGTGLFNLAGDDNNNALTGNASANTLVGGKGNDVLDGGAGADSMDGGDGDDTFHLDNAGDIFTDTGGTDTIVWHFTTGTYTLAADMENLVLFGKGKTNGTGNAGVNSLTGSDGVNTLDGGAGADVMAGGNGHDTYIVDDAGDVVTEAAPGGVDTVRSAVSFTVGANIEALILTGAGNINGTGGATSNTIIGNDGDNALDGGGATDKLAGGLGNDTYTVDLVATAGTAKLQDVITEAANAGTDTLILRAGALALTKAVTLTLGNNLENFSLALTGANANLNISGNKAANTLTGNDAANTLKGLEGADVLLGGLGNDILDGGAGIDTLTGGGGADTFLFHGKDAASALNADVILDFTAGAGGDVLDISELLSGYTGGALTGFVQLTEVGGDTIVSIDRDGAVNGAAFIQIATLDGVTGLDLATMLADGNIVAT